MKVAWPYKNTTQCSFLDCKIHACMCVQRTVCIHYLHPVLNKNTKLHAKMGSSIQFRMKNDLWQLIVWIKRKRTSFVMKWKSWSFECVELWSRMREFEAIVHEEYLLTEYHAGMQKTSNPLEFSLYTQMLSRLWFFSWQPNIIVVADVPVSLILRGIPS